MRPAMKLAGQRFGRLEAIRRVGTNEYAYAVWECKCECGTICYKTSQALMRGTQSCGCLQRERTAEAAKKRKGRKMGKYTKHTRWSDLGFPKFKKEGI